MSELKILKASAGSGKTHRLTQEYIELLFENPINYRHILAVTFTNKASEEMKSRIINELNILATEQDSSYLKLLSKKFNLNNEEIKNKALKALNLILHDYSRFSVITIDSFFQKCIKAFIKEIGIFSNFNIELDSNKILGESVDELLNSIGDDKELKKWIIQFSEEKIRDGKSWDLKKNIADLGKEIFKEEFSGFHPDFLAKLTDKSFLKSYRESIRKISVVLKKEYNSIGKEALDLIQSHSLGISDFSHGKGGLAGYLLNISTQFTKPGKRPENAIGEVEKWYTKTSEKKDLIINIYNSGLNTILDKAVSFYNINHSTYKTAEKIGKYLFALGILVDLSNKLKEYTKDKNLFMIADSNRLLRGIIDKSDTPFIYEKIGNFYNHFMIDEFQDTSGMQWDNFKPLITDSLSQNNISLVVGDTKQSIYRWRNGDWKLLAYKLEQQLSNLGTVTENLPTNWRSSANIVHFNNLFFRYTSEIIQKRLNVDMEGIPTDSFNGFDTIINKVYSDVRQELPESKKTAPYKGLVNMKFFEKDSFKENAMNSMIKSIEELQKAGYNAGDIAIIVRKNNEGKEIADYIFKYKESKEAKEWYNYNIISNESLFLKNSKAITLIINTLRHLQVPENIYYKAIILDMYNKLSNNTSENINDLTLIADDNGKFYSSIPEEFLNNSNKLVHLPLYEKIESIIRIFNLNKDEKNLPYLNSLQDMVFEFGYKESHDTSRFLTLWDDKQDSKALSIANQQDAIKITTIHKSKGLEFKAVIIPFCDWATEPKATLAPILWCEPDETPFNELKYIPLKYQTDLSESIFYKEYFNEKMQNAVDNLNLLYVAFTRAQETLYIFSLYEEKKAVAKNSIAGVFNEFFGSISKFDKINDSSNPDEFWNESEKEFRFGSFDGLEKKEISKDSDEQSSYYSESISGRIKIKTNASTYFDLENANSTKDSGTKLHQLFSLIHTKDDIEHALKQMVFLGHFNHDEALKLGVEINKRLDKSPFNEWFSESWTIKTEEAILSSDGNIKIPDRIMIKEDKVVIVDFKFGETESNQHKKQVARYQSLLSKMGYNNIESYLWYYSLDKLLIVDEIIDDHS